MNYKLLVLMCLLSVGVLTNVDAKSKKKQSKEETTTPIKKQTAYDKLFSKPHPKAEGLITLHKIGSKLYFEMPIKLMNRAMLLGSTVSEISDAGDATVGSKPLEPLMVFFTKIDSTVQMRQDFNKSITTEKEKEISSAIAKSNIGAIHSLFKIEAYSPDSLSVVFDVTKLFVGDRKDMSPLDEYSANTYGGLATRVARFQADKSFLGEFKSFSDNVMIRSHLSYECDLRYGKNVLQDKKPVTAVVARTLILLPEVPMQPRTADPRIGIFPSYMLQYTSDESRATYVFYANRWRLEPSDEQAFMRGEKVEPKKPIVFYIDSDFPESWVASIKAGIERWNEPFEKVGFKNAVQARKYPTKEEDKDFDPDNIKYSCIRYSPIGVANAMGPSWTDPRSGEILCASVYVYHNLVKLLYSWRFVQTAAVDATVREETLPVEVMDEAMKYVLTHEVGHCLGFMHNMAGSSTIPVDSLRSPSFTQTYGTTYSIMDYARNNYVAQPGDKELGVRLTPPNMGMYDDFLVKWSYSPLLDYKTAKQKEKVLNEWVAEKAHDPRFRYGKQQITVRLDPSSQSEDLSNDAMAAGEYGIKNLKYIIANMNQWFDAKGQDKNFSIRGSLYIEIIQQYIRYINHVFTNIGGIYLTERYSGDPTPSYEIVPKEKQKLALQFIMSQARNTKWIDNQDVMKSMQIMGSPGYDLQQEIVTRIVDGSSRLGLAETKFKNAYTSEEYMNDVYKFVWGSTMAGKKLDEVDRRLQSSFITSLIKNGATGVPKSRLTTGITAPDYISAIAEKNYGIATENVMGGDNDYGPQQRSAQSPEEISGFNFLYSVDFTSAPSLEYVYYNMLQKSRALIVSKIPASTGQDKMHYQLLLLRIDKAIQK